MSKSEARDLGLHPTATSRDIAYYRERAREREQAEEKTARLRALRLAKSVVPASADHAATDEKSE